MNVKINFIGIGRMTLPGITFMLCMLLSVAAWPQSVSTADMAARLNTRVNLLLGTTTLEKVTKSLSAATGLRIEASEYLRDRKLIVQMKDVSVANALNSLSELNDWRWAEVKENHLLIMRPIIKKPQTVAEIGLAIQSALPRDFRCYLGIGVPVDDLPLIERQDELQVYERDRADHPLRRQEMLARVRWKMPPMIKRQQNQLFESTLPGVLDGKELAIKRLTGSQTESLLVCLVINALSDLCGNNPTIIPTTPYNVMTGYLRADLLDVDKDEIFLLDGKHLMIGRTILDDGRSIYTGSEAPIELRPARPKTPKRP